MMRVLNGSNTESSSRSSFSKVTILEGKKPHRKRTPRFFQQNSLFSVDFTTELFEAVLTSMKTYNTGLAHQARAEFQQEGSHQTNLTTILQEYVNTPNLPPVVIFRVHSLVGCLRKEQKSYSMAIHSFTKALWLASAAKNNGSGDFIPRDDSSVALEQLGLTLHRLGKIHASLHNYLEASTLLHKAVQVYKAEGITSGPIYTDATNALEQYAGKHKFSQQAWCSSPQLTLDVVREEDEDEEEEQYMDRRPSV